MFSVTLADELRLNVGLGHTGRVSPQINKNDECVIYLTLPGATKLTLESKRCQSNSV